MINRRTILYVDGYNIINAWPNLKEVLNFDLGDSRDMLNDYMFEYSTYYGEEVWVVYDAYMTNSKKEKIEKRDNLYIVYTKEYQTADSFIEKSVKTNSADGRIILKVATSDWAQQRQVLGSGGIRLTPWELKANYNGISAKIEKKYKHKKPLNSTIESRISKKSLAKLAELIKKI